MSALTEDQRLVLRRLVRAPATSLLAVGMLGLGIGAHAAIYSLIHTVFLRPLQVPGVEQLVALYESRDGKGFAPISLPDFRDYRSSASSFDGLVAHYPGAPLSVLVGDESLEVNGSVVSAGYFALLGVEPARGRFFLADEDAAEGAPGVAVVSDRFWRRHLTDAEEAIGSTIVVNGVALTVVGVSPSSFEGVRIDLPSDIWIPMGLASVGYRWCGPAERDCRFLNLIGRLRPGASVDGAQAEMDVLSRQIAESERPEDEVVRGLQVVPLQGIHPASRGRLWRQAGLLLVAVTLLLIVVAANLGGLLLARGVARVREIAIMRALGAGWLRVAGQFMTEALLLSGAGALFGLGVAAAFGRVLGRFVLRESRVEVGLEPAVIGYLMLVALLTGLVIGALPALLTVRATLVPALRGELSFGARLLARGRVRPLATLVVVQLAVSFVLLAWTGLLTKSLLNLGRIESPDPGSVLTFRLRPRLLGYEPPQAAALHREVVRRLEAVAGVRSVSFGAGLPPGLWGRPVSVRQPETNAPVGGAVEKSAWSNLVAPRFFETFGLSLLRGRDFDHRDVGEAAAVVVVSERLAATLWPQDDALGKPLLVDGRAVEVVGVVQGTSYLESRDQPLLEVYLPYSGDPSLVDARFGVLVEGDAVELKPALRSVIQTIDSRVPIVEIATMQERLDSHWASTRLAGRVITLSSALAVLLSAIGIYAVLSLVVNRRHRDLGVHVALGADRRQVIALVVRDVLLQLVLAIALGLVAMLTLGRLLDDVLYRTSAVDPGSLAAATLALVGVAGLASWWPARRAAGVDPLKALRAE